MNITCNPEALTSIQWVCATVSVVVVCRTAYHLLRLVATRRRDRLFDHMAKEAMASGRPVTITNEEIKRQ